MTIDHPLQREIARQLENGYWVEKKLFYLDPDTRVTLGVAPLKPTLVRVALEYAKIPLSTTGKLKNYAQLCETLAEKIQYRGNVVTADFPTDLQPHGRMHRTDTLSKILSGFSTGSVFFGSALDVAMAGSDDECFSRAGFGIHAKIDEDNRWLSVGALVARAVPYGTLMLVAQAPALDKIDLDQVLALHETINKYRSRRATKR